MARYWEWIKEHPYATAGVVAAVLFVLWYLGFFGGSSSSSQSDGTGAYYAATAAAAQASEATNIAQIQAQAQLAALQTSAEATTKVELGKQATDVTLAQTAADVQKTTASDALSAYLQSLTSNENVAHDTNQFQYMTVANVNEADVTKTLAGFSAAKDETTTLANVDLQKALAGYSTDLSKTQILSGADVTKALGMYDVQKTGLAADVTKTLASLQTTENVTNAGAYSADYQAKLQALVGAGATPTDIGTQTGFTPLDLTSWATVWPSAKQGYINNINAYGKAVFGPGYGG